MSEKKTPSVLSIAAALAALPGAVGITSPAEANTPANAAAEPSPAQKHTEAANAFFSVGEDLLSFTIHKSADGTIVADHRSHSSHSSHRSHYSSR